MKVLDHGFLELDASCADDLSVVNAARVSLHNRHEQMEEGDAKLINALMKNKHGTPFEHNFFRFRVKAPIFVFREWHRHRIGHSYNEWSARYSALKPEFYSPTNEQVRKQVGKAMSYTYEPASESEAEIMKAGLRLENGRAFQKYQDALDSGIAKEVARLFLPVNIYSEMYWSCNARSLMNFLALRNAPQAQWEIRQYALRAESIFSKIMPITHLSFNSNRRVAP